VATMGNDAIVIDVKQSPTDADVYAVQNGSLWAFNVAHTGDDNLQRLAIHACNAQGDMLGGLVGTYLWGWLHIETLFIGEPFRHRGVGTQLMLAAEQDARRRGIRNVHLETLSFQARPFYEKLGYEVFGTLEDFPPGHQQYFMRKSLPPA
jgi:GNAT superfamily N-acetyltransferase